MLCPWSEIIVTSLLHVSRGLVIRLRRHIWRTGTLSNFRLGGDLGRRYT
jgi:hypothetical protein